MSTISVLNDEGDRTNPYGNGDADEVDETNVLVPVGFTQPLFNPCSWKDSFTKIALAWNWVAIRNPRVKSQHPSMSTWTDLRG